MSVFCVIRYILLHIIFSEGIVLYANVHLIILLVDTQFVAHLFFVLFYFFRERKGVWGAEKRHRCERETSIGCLPHRPWPSDGNQASNRLVHRAASILYSGLWCILRSISCSLSPYCIFYIYLYGYTESFPFIRCTSWYICVCPCACVQVYASICQMVILSKMKVSC